jgi:hypothetical protein
MDRPTVRKPATAKWWSKLKAAEIASRFTRAKLEASTAESSWRSPRRKDSQPCSRSAVPQATTRSRRTVPSESFQASATSRAALRSRKVNVSNTTGTEV